MPRSEIILAACHDCMFSEMCGKWSSAESLQGTAVLQQPNLTLPMKTHTPGNCIAA